MKVLNKCSHLPPTKNTKLMFGFLLFPVHWRCVHWRDGGQGAAPGQQQAEVASQRIWYRHPHQPHPLQQPMELHVPASSTAQVCSTWFLRGSVHLQNFMAIHPVAVVCSLHKNRVKLIFNITEQAVYYFLLFVYNPTLWPSSQHKLSDSSLSFGFCPQVDGLHPQSSRCSVCFSTSAERKTSQGQHRLQWLPGEAKENQKGHSSLNTQLHRYPAPSEPRAWQETTILNTIVFQEKSQKLTLTDQRIKFIWKSLGSRIRLIFGNHACSLPPCGLDKIHTSEPDESESSWFILTEERRQSRFE